MPLDDSAIKHFDALADTWWDSNGPLRTLHCIHPVRMQFILEQKSSLSGQRIVDIGCGAGILSESLAMHHAEVVGIDASSGCIDAARSHAKRNPDLKNTSLSYTHVRDIAAWSSDHLGCFDGAVCMELLEHLDDPALMIQCIASVLKPGGFCFFSTINRHPFAYLSVILAAEYLLGLIPKGTHHYAQFIKPSELNRTARSMGIDCLRYQGFAFQPLTQRAYYVHSLTSNYMAFGIKTCPLASNKG